MTLANFSLDPLHDVSTKAALKTLIHIIQSSLGPHGRLKILQHSVGGASTLTSSSQRLLNQISARNIFTKVILSTAKCQLKLLNDGGLYCMLFTLKLIFCSLYENPLPLVGILHTYFFKLYMECLLDEAHPSVLSVEFDNLYQLRCIVMTLLSSKPGCALTTADKNHLCTLLLKAFLGVVPSFGSSIKFLTVNGISAKDTRLVEGILLPVSKLDGNNFSGSVTCRVALFSTSLSEDIEFPTQSIENRSSDTIQEMTLTIVKKLILKLIAAEVDFVFCQKVIHPRFKAQLKNAGVFVLDQLGSQAFQNVHYIIGGGIINSSVFSEPSYSSISSLRCENFDKTFIRLCNDQFPSFTLLLGNYNEQTSAELKVVCEQTIDCLFRILKSRKVCFGGGCTEIHTALLLASKMKEGKVVFTIQKETGCHPSQIQVVCESFLRCIADVSVAIHQGSKLDFVTENVQGHLWKVRDDRCSSAKETCQCGQFSTQDLGDVDWITLTDIGQSTLASPSVVDRTTPDTLVLLDELSCKKSSLSLAFETAGLLLRTSVCINNSCGEG